MRVHRRAGAVVAAMAIVMALPGIASANTTEAVAETGGMTLSIPGVPLTIGVTLDDFGNIDTVDVGNPEFAVTKEKPEKVRFVRDAGEDGSTVVQVRARGSKLSAKVKTSNLAELVGTHTWSGDVFGTGEPTTVTFGVADVDGHAELTTVNVGVGNAAFQAAVTGPETGNSDHHGKERWRSSARVDFAWDGYKRTLKLNVSTTVKDDELRAKLSVELRGKDRRELIGADALGTHTWVGLLCDGTNAEVAYTVTEDGATVDSVSVADGASSDVRDRDHGFSVRFTDTNGHDDAYVKVWLSDEDGTLELKVKSRTTTSCDDDDRHRGDRREGNRDHDGRDRDGRDRDHDKRDGDRNRGDS